MNKKLALSTTSMKQTIKEWVLISLGAIIYSFSWVGVVIPANGMGGGATGMALLIYYATGGGAAGGGIPVNISYLVINAILILLAVIILGAKFGIKTIYSIFLISFSMGILQRIVPDNIFGLANDKLLSAVLGGAIAGLGISLVLMQGGSTGGSDIIAMIINKYRNISYGRVVMVVDFIVIALSYFIYWDLAPIIYGFILTATFSLSVDSIMAGTKQSSQLFIMSENYQAIADLITHEFHRGVTVLDGTGWYTQKPSKVIMVAVRKPEANYILQKIKSLDSKAFITMSSVMGVYGEGFDTFRK